MSDYECHITFLPKAKKYVQIVAEMHGWKVSQITGDPVLGDKKRFVYATLHMQVQHVLEVRMRTFCRVIDCLIPNTIVRRKIERTMLDERFIDDKN